RSPHSDRGIIPFADITARTAAAICDSGHRSAMAAGPGYFSPGPRGGQVEPKRMSIEIEVLNGDASWPLAQPLMEAVWPAHVLEKLPWGDMIFAHADLRVLVQSE